MFYYNTIPFRLLISGSYNPSQSWIFFRYHNIVETEGIGKISSGRDFLIKRYLKQTSLIEGKAMITVTSIHFYDTEVYGTKPLLLYWGITAIYSCVISKKLWMLL